MTNQSRGRDDTLDEELVETVKRLQAEIVRLQSKLNKSINSVKQCSNLLNYPYDSLRLLVVMVDILIDVSCRRSSFKSC